MDLLFCAKYPFTKEAKEYVKEAGAKLDGEILGRAKKRVLSALLEGAIPQFSESLSSNFPQEIFSYAASRMLVSQTKGRYFINRYAVAESKRASEYLRKDSEENLQTAMAEFGIPYLVEEGKFKIPVFKYLKYSPKDIHYKLSNMELKEGFVMLGREEKQKLVRLVEEAVKKSIESSLPIQAKVPAEITKTANEIIKLLPKEELPVSKISSEDFPPCIRELLDRLAASENLPHTARWALAVYLTNAGMDVDKITSLFKTAPDFSDSTTRYQVTHVKEKGYKMPSCATMDTYGICNAVCRCFTPLKYRKGMEKTRGFSPYLSQGDKEMEKRNAEKYGRHYQEHEQEKEAGREKTEMKKEAGNEKKTSDQ